MERKTALSCGKAAFYPSGTSPDIAKHVEVPEYQGFRLVALDDQVLQLGDFRRDIDRFGIRASLDIGADVEVVTLGGERLLPNDAGQLLDLAKA